MAKFEPFDVIAPSGVYRFEGEWDEEKKCTYVTLSCKRTSEVLPTSVKAGDKVSGYIKEIEDVGAFLMKLKAHDLPVILCDMYGKELWHITALPINEDDTSPHYNPDMGWVTCHVHGRQKAWFVCNHIDQIENVVIKVPWREQLGGELICFRGGRVHTPDDIHVECEAHLRERGILPAA